MGRPLQLDAPVATAEASPPPPLASPRDPSPGAVLTVSGLTKSYGPRPALHGVTFAVTPGVTGLLGPNGAGKSTLLRCLAGLSGWDAGEVRIAGVDPVRSVAAARRLVGYMPERVAFPAEMRAGEYLRFVAEVKGVPRRDRAAAVDAVVRAAGLEAARDRVIANLSKGYRQRVGLGQALLGEPPLVILDEPSAGLDPISMMDLRDTLRACAAERAVLVSTHLLAEARVLCDRVIVMSSGLVVYDGPPGGMATEEAFREAVLGGAALGGAEP